MCDAGTETPLAGGKILGDAVLSTRAQTATAASAGIAAASVIVPFGPTNLNVTFERFNNCTHGGPLDVCGVCKVLVLFVFAFLSDASFVLRLDSALRFECALAR